ncbi:hypothetical protein ACTHQY_09010 [Rhodococcoides corynebacterioides]|uniref:hypothetical protein n=1 Tax=Rhodococcoides corynebacterioides TaxID=53972 RepID=UPI003F80FA68
MVWFNVDDTLAFHQKTIRAGNPAMGLWVRAGSWCAQTLTNGFVPRSIARSLGTAKQAQALVNAGLWEELSTGFQFPNWEERQRTKAEVEASREAERQRKAEQRKRRNVPVGHPAGRGPESQGVSQPTSQGESRPESQGVSQHPSHSMPSQAIPSSDYVEGGSHVSNRAGEEPPLECPKHQGDPNPPKCGACKAARLAHEKWSQNRREDEIAIRRSRRTEIDACRICDDQGWVIGAEPVIRCTHQPMRRTS